MTTTRKISELHLNALKPGDIILFRPSPEIYASQKWIIFFQSFISATHGHRDTTHSALCVENEAKTGPVIAHTYQVGEKWSYFRHTMSTMQKEEAKDHPANIDRPFLVFRPKNQRAAQMAADVAGNEEKNKHIQWTSDKMIKPFFRPATWGLSKDRPMSKEIKSMPNTAICSEFVIKAVKIAECKRYAAGEKIPDRMCIRSSSSPKALEAYLYNDIENYDLLIYPGKNPLQKLITVIQAELSKVERRHYRCNTHSKNKRDIVALLCKQQAEKQSGLTELEQCLELLGKVMPILNQHSGFGWFGLSNTTSYNVVRDQARKMGIFERDFQKNTQDQQGKEEKSTKLSL